MWVRIQHPTSAAASAARDRVACEAGVQLEGVHGTVWIARRAAGGSRAAAARMAAGRHAGPPAQQANHAGAHDPARLPDRPARLGLLACLQGRLPVSPGDDAAWGQSLEARAAALAIESLLGRPSAPVGQDLEQWLASGVPAAALRGGPQAAPLHVLAAGEGRERFPWRLPRRVVLPP